MSDRALVNCESDCSNHYINPIPAVLYTDLPLALSLGLANQFIAKNWKPTPGWKVIKAVTDMHKVDCEHSGFTNLTVFC